MDLVPHTRTVALPSASEAQRLWTLANQVQATDMVPADFRGKPEAVLACALAGREIGLGFFEALRSFYVVDGRPSESAELLHTLALRAGHDVRVEVSDRTRCLVLARNRSWPDDRPDLPVEWTIADAAAAELMAWDCVDSLDQTGHHDVREVSKQGRNGPYTRRECGCKDNWRSYTRAMLRSRAISEAVRAVCPEVTVGATYTAEELGAVVEGPGGRPVGAAHGWGASGAGALELPSVEDVDATWVASQEVDVVLALVDHYGPDEIVAGAGEVRLVEWVRRCERARPEADRRPRLLEALDARDDRADVVDAEIVEDDDEGEEGPSGTDGEPADPVRPDAPAAPSSAPPEDLGEERGTDAGDAPTTDEPASEEPVDLADVPDPSEESARYGAWLAAVTDAYRDLNVGDVVHLIRDGWVDLESGERLAIPSGPTGLNLVARLEEHSAGPFRRTVRGALESAGWREPVAIPGDGPQEATQEPAGDDGREAEASTPETGPDAPGRSQSVEEGSRGDRLALLTRWKRAYREIDGLPGDKADRYARASLSVRMQAGAGHDDSWRTANVKTLRDLVAQIERLRDELTAS